MCLKAPTSLDFVITCSLNEEGHQATPPSIDIKKEDSNDNAALNTTRYTLGIWCFYCLLVGHYASACPKKASDVKEKEEEGCKQVQGLASAAVAFKVEEYAFGAVEVDKEENFVA
jgi:hypothetical protein